LERTHDATVDGNLALRIGQALEIAVYKALRTQAAMFFFGAFKDLDAHDDASLYKKEKPSKIVSGHQMNKLDFTVVGGGTLGGIEVKNTRPWVYPDSDAVIDLLKRCCAVDAVPILIARRIDITFEADALASSLLSDKPRKRRTGRKWTQRNGDTGR